MENIDKQTGKKNYIKVRYQNGIIGAIMVEEYNNLPTRKKRQIKVLEEKQENVHLVTKEEKIANARITKNETFSTVKVKE